MSESKIQCFRTEDMGGRPIVETIDCWKYNDGRVHIGHRAQFGVDYEGVVESRMILRAEQATFLRDRLTDILGHDAAYEAWIASRDKAYGVGPLDIEDPASRFAHEEPLPATDAEYAERQIERGGA